MHDDFDSAPDRRGTGSLKWDRYGAQDVLPFWVADMDFRSPPEVIEALRARVDHGVFGYTNPTDAAVGAVLDYLEQRHGVAVEARALVWLPGLVPALNIAARAFAGPGEAVLTATPVYPPFLSAPGNQGRALITVALREAGEGYALDLDAMERAVTPQTRVFFLCNPHNPVGKVYTRAELEALLAFCERHDLIVVADEIHCDLCLDGEPHTSFFALGEAAQARSLLLHAPSKTYNLPGLSCAFAVVPDARLSQTFQRALQGVITEVNCMGYAGCAAAYRHGEPWRQALIEVLRANRERVYAFVREHCPRLGLRPMQATYLAWMDARALGLKHPVAHFEAHGLGLSDGAHFGAPGWLRLNFGCPPRALEAGLERLRTGHDAAGKDG